MPLKNLKDQTYIIPIPLKNLKDQSIKLTLYLLYFNCSNLLIVKNYTKLYIILLINKLYRNTTKSSHS